MNVGTDYSVRIIKNLSWVVCKDNLCFCPFFFNETFIVVYIVHICERMAGFAEKFFEAFLSKHISIRINTLFIH